MVPRRAPFATASPSLSNDQPSNARRARRRTDTCPRSSWLRVSNQRWPRAGCWAQAWREKQGNVADRSHPSRLSPRRRRPCQSATFATTTPGGGGTVGLPCTRAHGRREDDLADDTDFEHRCRVVTTLEGPQGPASPCSVVDAKRIPPPFGSGACSNERPPRRACPSRSA